MAWHTLETNQFGTNEFIDFCRRLETEPYLVVNAGDGDMREARDWVEYCNGTQPTALVKLRQQHGYRSPAPRPVLGHRQRGGRPLADWLQDAPGIRSHRHRVRQGHEVGRPGDQADRQRRLQLGCRRLRGARPTLAGTGGRPDRLPGPALVRGQPHRRLRGLHDALRIVRGPTERLRRPDPRGDGRAQAASTRSRSRSTSGTSGTASRWTARATPP